MTARVIIIGKSGQLAQALLGAQALAAAVPPAEAAMTGLSLTFLGRADLPSQDPQALRETLAHHRPDIVINAAAFSAVDLAEQQPYAAAALNTALPMLLAAYCQESRIPFIHVSSDYVFDGGKGAPYLESDPLLPINAYGRSKAAADEGVMTIMPAAAIVRTSWVFGLAGASFPQKIIAAGRKNQAVKVVNDQIGRPTFAGDLAQVVLQVAARALARHPDGSGVVNFANSGIASWHDVARIVIDAVNAHDRSAITLTPISAGDLNLPARRPAYSVLDTALYERRFATQPRPWDQALREILPALMM